MITRIETQNIGLDVWVEIMHEIREYVVKKAKGKFTELTCNSQKVTVNQPLLCQEALLLTDESFFHHHHPRSTMIKMNQINDQGL